MDEVTIGRAARATGTSRRALRHYEELGLVSPSRDTGSGYRTYDPDDLVRILRIATLRAAGVPLADIAATLDDPGRLVDALRAHQATLAVEIEALARQAAIAAHTIRALEEGTAVMADDEHEAEVRARWGDEAWERSSRRRAGMTTKERAADDERTAEVNGALRTAAEEGADPAGERFGALVAAHHAWVTDQWGGRPPERDAYVGLAAMYVADPRFAVVYGGEENAERVRAAIEAWAAVNLAT
jgi:DNA-binding transcriptional MerR regulator